MYTCTFDRGYCGRAVPPGAPILAAPLAPGAVEPGGIGPRQGIEHHVGAGDQPEVGPQELADHHRVRVGLDHHGIVGYERPVTEVRFELVTYDQHQVGLGDSFP